MDITQKSFRDFSRNPQIIEEICGKGAPVVLTKQGKVQYVIMNVALFNELVELADQATMYKGLWQSELTYSPRINPGDSGVNEKCLPKQVLLLLVHRLMPQPRFNVSVLLAWLKRLWILPLLSKH